MFHIKKKNMNTPFKGWLAGRRNELLKSRKNTLIQRVPIIMFFFLNFLSLSDFQGPHFDTYVCAYLQVIFQGNIFIILHRDGSFQDEGGNSRARRAKFFSSPPTNFPSPLKVSRGGGQGGVEMKGKGASFFLHSFMEKTLTQGLNLSTI